MVKKVLIAALVLLLIVFIYATFFDTHEADHVRTTEQLQEECDNSVDKAGNDQYSAEECEEMVAEYEAEHKESHE